MKIPSKKRRKRSQKKTTIKIQIGRVVFDIFLCFFALTLIPVLVFRYINPPSTPLMWIRSFQSDNQSSRHVTTWQTIENISPNLLKAVVTAEDQKFFSHKGFDWIAIEYAIQVNLTTDRKIGASTISMQTARNVFLWQERTWLRKILEVYFTTLIELFWDKKRILEVYLNVIEWGEGVFGCNQASLLYFKRPPSRLSPVESAWMAAILPSPRKWSRQPAPSHIRIRQAKILDSMIKMHIP